MRSTERVDIEALVTRSDEGLFKKYEDFEKLVREIVKLFQERNRLKASNGGRKAPSVHCSLSSIGKDFKEGRAELKRVFGLTPFSENSLSSLMFQESRDEVTQLLGLMTAGHIKIGAKRRYLSKYKGAVARHKAWRKSLEDNPLLDLIDPDEFTYESLSKAISFTFKSRMYLGTADDPEVRAGQMFLQYSVPQFFRALKQLQDRQDRGGKIVYEKISEDIQALKKASKGDLALLYLSGMTELDVVDSPMEHFLVGGSWKGAPVPCAIASEKLIEKVYERNLYLRDVILEAAELNAGEFIGNLVLNWQNKSPEKIRELLDLTRKAVKDLGIKVRTLETLFKDEGAASLVYFLRYAVENAETFKLCKTLRKRGVSPGALVSFLETNKELAVPYEGDDLSIEDFVFKKCTKAFQQVSLAAIIKRGGILFTEEAFDSDREDLIQVALEVPQGDEVMLRYISLIESGSRFKAKLLLAAGISSGLEPLSGSFYTAFDSLSEEDCRDLIVVSNASKKDAHKKVFVRAAQKRRGLKQVLQTDQVCLKPKSSPWIAKLIMEAMQNRETMPAVGQLHTLWEKLDDRSKLVLRSVWQHRPEALVGFCDDAVKYAENPAYNQLLGDSGHCRRYVDALGENGDLIEQIRLILDKDCPSNPHAVWNELLLDRPVKVRASIPAKEKDEVPAHLQGVKPLEFERIVVFSRDFAEDALEQIRTVGQEYGVRIDVRPLARTDKKVKSFDGISQTDLVIVCIKHIGHQVLEMARRKAPAKAEFRLYKHGGGHELLCQYLTALLDCRK